MKKILIVDDDEKIQKIYDRLLTAEGFNVNRALNAEEGCNILKNSPVDLVLLDIKLPEIGGNVVYEAVKKLNRKIKVIVSSVCPLDEQKQLIPEASDYYDKSQGIDLLLHKIESALKESV